MWPTIDLADSVSEGEVIPGLGIETWGTRHLVRPCSREKELQSGNNRVTGDGNDRTFVVKNREARVCADHDGRIEDDDGEGSENGSHKNAHQLAGVVGAASLLGPIHVHTAAQAFMRPVVVAIAGACGSESEFA